MTIPELIVLVCSGYVLLGLMFAVAFVVRGVTQLDPAARGTSLTFRVIIFPGSVALWPILARKWIAHTRTQP